MRVTGAAEGRLAQPNQFIKFSYGGQHKSPLMERSNSSQQLQQTSIRVQGMGAPPIVYRRESAGLMHFQQQQQGIISLNQSQEPAVQVVYAGMQSAHHHQVQDSSQTVQNQSKSLRIVQLDYQDSRSRGDKQSPLQSPRSQQPPPKIADQYNKQPLSFQPIVTTCIPMQANLLKKERIVVVDQSDHKLELEVLRMKYKALEDKCNQLEHQIEDQGSAKQPSSSIHRQQIEEDLDEQLPSSDRIEEVLAERVELQVEQLKDEFRLKQQQTKAQFEGRLTALQLRNNQFAEEIRVRQMKIQQLQSRIHNDQSDGFFSPRSNQDKSRKESTLIRQQSTTSIANYEIELQNSRLRMEQLTAELDSRNRELAALREKFQPLQSAQSESRQQLEEAKQAIQIGEQELFSIRSGLEEARNRHQVQLENQRRRMQQSIDDYQQQLLRTTQELNRKDDTLAKLSSQQQSLYATVSKTTEELRRLQTETSNQIGTLKEELRLSKLAEESYKESIAKYSQSNRSLILSDQQKSSKINSISSDLKSCKMVLEETRRQASETIKQAEVRLATSKRRVIELEGELSQLNLELQHAKNSQPVTVVQQPPPPPSNNRNKQQLALLLERRNQQLQARRIDYQNNLRRLRQECQDSYRETLQMHQDKIEELQRKLYRRREQQRYSHKRTHTTDSKLMKRVVSEKLFNQLESNATNLFDELQQHVEESQQKIQRVIEACRAEFSTRGQANLKELKGLMLGLSARIEYCRHQNTKMKVKAANESDNNLRRVESKRKFEPEKDSAMVHSLQIELAKCKKMIAEYEMLLFQAQNAKPPKHTDESEERLTILQEKVAFYKEKNTEMEKRTNNLLQLNSTLKVQLEEAARLPTGNLSTDQIQKQILIEQANSKLQEKVRELGDEIMQIRSEHLFKLQSCEREWQNRLNQQEQCVVDLNVKMASLKNELAVSENELKLHRDTLQHREVLLSESANKIGSQKKQLQELSQERRKRQEVETTLAQTVSRLNSLTSERNNLDSENSSMKKHVSYLQKQLLTSNEKSSNLGSTNLAMDLQLTQAKTAALFHERRNEQLMQEVKTLQRYRTECDTAANEDRHRMNQLEVKLRDSYYELEKANKAKQTLEGELTLLRNSFNTQKQQLLKLGQIKRQLESQLNKLRIDGKHALVVSRQVQIANESQQKVVFLTEELRRVKERLEHTQNRLAEVEKDESDQQLEGQRASELQARLALIMKEHSQLRQHNLRMQEEKQTFETQARTKIFQLEETLNSLNNNSNSSTEREHQHELTDEHGRELLVHTLTQRVRLLEQQLTEYTEVYQSRFEVVNREFQERYIGMEQYYRNRIAQLQRLLDESKSTISGNQLLVQFSGLGYLLQRIRSNCRTSVVLIEEVELRNEQSTQPLEGLISTISDTINQLEELIKCYNALQGVEV